MSVIMKIWKYIINVKENRNLLFYHLCKYINVIFGKNAAKEKHYINFMK